MAKIPVIRLVEDAVIVAGTAASTYQATGSVADALNAACAAPVVRSGLALLLSAGESSGLAQAIGILRRALKLLNGSPAQTLVLGENVAPTPTDTPAVGKHGATV